MPPLFRHVRCALLVVGGVLCGGSSAWGIIFYDTADVTHNREVAPGGAWAGSGWQWQGTFGNYLGTMISPRHFITAKHFGVDSTFINRRAYFTGAGSDAIYHTNPHVNGGLGYWHLAGTDFRILEIYGEFADYAPLYTVSTEASNEVGKQLVVFGRGRQRGVEVQSLGQPRGWKWVENDRRARWGVNDVDSIVDLGASYGDALVFDFDAVVGQEECQLALYDSGGGVFIKDGATWKLAGINFFVDGYYDTNDTCGDGSHFDAAMFDATGFYIGQDNAGCDQWDLILPLSNAAQSRSFVSRISASAGTIQGIIQPAIDDAALSSTERYENWVAGYGVTTDDLPEENADGDQWDNLVEYFGVGDPSAAGDVVPFKVVPGAGVVRFEVRENLSAESLGMTWVIAKSTTLGVGSYTPVAGMSVISSTVDRVQGVRNWVYQIPMPTAPETFYRLEVTLAP